MSEWLHVLRQVSERGVEAVLVTVVSGKGSTPREAGAKMVVTMEANHGTIGGGELEFQAITSARNMLRAPDRTQSQRVPLGTSLGQFCGGAAELLFERVPAHTEWLRVLGAWHDAGAQCVIATPANAMRDGRLLVRADTSWGTLADDVLDRRAIDVARTMLGDVTETPALVTLGAEGRSESLLFERAQAIDFHVVLFGAGHVGRALVRVLGTLACKVTWIDSRPEQFPDPVAIAANVRVVRAEQPVAEVRRMEPGSYFIVMTHSHALDFELVTAILERGDFAYCGMIGSATKRRTFENGLAKRGLRGEALQRLTCPIGIPALKGKQPATIAVAVAAQLLEVRERLERAKAQAVPV
jgi:xanthine dehydrogenase accessory factor